MRDAGRPRPSVEGAQHHGAEHRHRDREAEVEPADDDELPTGHGGGRRTRAKVALEPRAEHEVVQQSSDDEERDEHRTMKASVTLRQPQSREDRNRHRAPTDRPPPTPERPHRNRARLTLESPDGRDSDEHERHCPAHPDARREDVEDAERGHHAAPGYGFPPKRPPARGGYGRAMGRDWALFLHLVGVLLFVGGSVGVTALRLLAIGKERPSESALLLRAVRPLVP